MKLIDFDTKGNLIRFYFGKDDDNEYYGDDWDDRPYQYNAGPVYDRFVVQTLDCVLPWDYNVLTPEDDYGREYCKDDMKEGRIPCVIITEPQTQYTYAETDFGYAGIQKNSTKFYFNDPFDDVRKRLLSAGGTVIYKMWGTTDTPLENYNNKCCEEKQNG